MSKSDEESKPKMHIKQGDLFDDTEGVGKRKAGSTSRPSYRTELLSRLTEQRALTRELVTKIADYGNLLNAYKEVRQNKGTGGVDGETLESYGVGLDGRIKALQGSLKRGEYSPQSVRLVEIPKSNGGVRKLGIPTIEDRVVQQSMLNALQPIYDPYFSEHSYGFRPGRSAHQAIEAASRYVQTGKVWVVDIDLASFFDEINHDRLMNRLSKGISDQELLVLIRKYLKAGMMKEGLVSQRVAGTPQGGPLSPLLSNIVLDELDRELEVRGLSFARYADDCNIFVKSKRSADRVIDSLIKYIEDVLKLKVNRDKSGVRRCNEVKFLGHTVESNGKIRIADGSIVRFKQRIREVTKRNRGISFSNLIKEVNLVIQGWGVYYRKCNTWLGEGGAKSTRRSDQKAFKMLCPQATSKTLPDVPVPKEPRCRRQVCMECSDVPEMVGDGQLSTSHGCNGNRMVCKTRIEILISRPKGLKVRENRRGTLKRMPGGVGGTAAKAAYLSRLC